MTILTLLISLGLALGEDSPQKPILLNFAIDPIVYADHKFGFQTLILDLVQTVLQPDDVLIFTDPNTQERKAILVVSQKLANRSPAMYRKLFPRLHGRELLAIKTHLQSFDKPEQSSTPTPIKLFPYLLSVEHLRASCLDDAAATRRQYHGGFAQVPQ